MSGWSIPPLVYLAELAIRTQSELIAATKYLGDVPRLPWHYETVLDQRFKTIKKGVGALDQVWLELRVMPQNWLLWRRRLWWLDVLN
jgi:hypothetical protein